MERSNARPRHTRPDGTATEERSGWRLGYEEHVLPPLDNPDVISRARLDERRKPYRASVPAEIADASFDIGTAVLAEADDASAAIARFDADFAAYPAPFASVLLRTESASSSQIENLTSGARAIAEAEIDERAAGNAPLVVSNVRAMEAAIALSDTIDNEAIIRMHETLLQSSAPQLTGRYRDEQVWIGGHLPHDASFVPPHHDRVAAAMADLIAFIGRTDIPVLAHAALAHAQFETIHPFPDGNGHTGRALVQAMLRHGRLLRHMTIPVSSGLLCDLDSYFDALTAYRGGDPEPIVTVFSVASLAGLGNARHLADELSDLQATWGEKLRGVRSDAVARKIATLSIEHPVINSKLAIRELGRTPPSILNGIKQLTQLGILRSAYSRNRNQVWINDAVIEALDAFAARAGRRQHP